ncbi:MAG: Gfo/Idh/MocA family oxidoreductase [Verrucomicrobiota bacterium]
MKEVNIALLGHRFMGRAHSNAWRQVGPFFEPELRPRLKVICGRDEAALAGFAENWGWEEVETDWRRVIERDDIDVVDISLPTFLHAEVAIAAAEAGKHLFCEKPAALTSAEAEAMLAAAEKAGVVHYLNHNYRRVPAVLLARELIEEGKIGEIYHWRGAYQQSWGIDPTRLLNWKLKKATAGGGPLWDLGSHAVDLAHYLVGDIATVQGMSKTFVKERPLEEDPSKTGEVEVEDASLMQVEFECGALGTIESTRFATGRRNRHTFELYGSEGALAWDLEDLNRLEYYANGDEAKERGFRDLNVTELVHPHGGKWWPPGHIIGYEHTFVHAVADFLDAVAGDGRIEPNFEDGVKIMRVLEAAQA